MFIVDNSTANFVNHLAHGIPIVPFHGEAHDEELKSLSEYLIGLAEKDDPKAANAAYFSLQQLKQSECIQSGFQSLLAFNHFDWADGSTKNHSPHN